MTKTTMTTIAILCTATVAMTGCCSGMKTTFVNDLDKTIEPNFHTVGEGNSHVKVGPIEPGGEKTVCIKFGKLLPAKFAVTVFEATPDALRYSVPIPKDFPDEVTVMILPGKDVDVVIRIIDGDGNELKPR